VTASDARAVPVLRERAPGKVNLCLFLGGLRADGLHELVSLLEPVTLADELELGPADGAGDELSCPGVEGPNLASAALAAFRTAAGWDGPAVRITIDKRVPVAAGMGGGSSDAAATLRLAARAAGRGTELLAGIAPQLGADVPALLEPAPALVTGAGERVERLPALPPHGLLVLPAGRPLSTPEVFHEADRLGLPRSADELAERAADVRAALARAELPAPVNDLEPAARSLRPSIDDALRAMREAGAAHALVSGSGPTVTGLFPSRAAAREAAIGLPGAIEVAPA
jgi:4-diphosphocytidyl-2-C-methyl-D-erythritol kinase